MDERFSENMQTLLTPSDKVRVESLADKEMRSVSDMLRVLILESLKRWEDSAAGRRRK